MDKKYLSLNNLSIFYSRIKEWINQTFAEKYHIHSISEIEGLQEKIDELTPSLEIETSQDVITRINQLTNIVNSLIPAIGELYITTIDENPSVRFGGVWEQIKDTFLLASGDTYIAGETGGESEHILTIEEIPSHTHNYKRHEFNRTDTDPETGESIYGVNNKTLSARMGTTDSVGGGQPHNNMPPYLAVYVWKRVA